MITGSLLNVSFVRTVVRPFARLGVRVMLPVVGSTPICERPNAVAAAGLPRSAASLTGQELLELAGEVIGVDVLALVDVVLGRPGGSLDVELADHAVDLVELVLVGLDDELVRALVGDDLGRKERRAPGEATAHGNARLPARTAGPSRS